MALRFPLTSASRCMSARRSYATAASSSSSSLVPILLGAAAVGGGAYYYYSGGAIPDPKQVKQLEDKAKAAITGQSIPAMSSVKAALDPKEFQNFKLKQVIPYNHNTSNFIFELPDGQESGLVTASCVVTKAADDSLKDDQGKPVIRPYTPVDAPGQKGTINFLIKNYVGGKMSKHIFSLKPGDELAIKGPIKKLEYHANEFDQIAFVMGGSGITPAWQVLQEIDANPEDKTKATLIFANVEEKDILLRKELESLAKRKPDQFKIIFSLDKPPKGWTGPAGLINAELLGKNLPPAGLGDKIKVALTGPPPMVAAIAGPKDGMKQGELKGLLADLGYQQSQVFKF